MLNKVIGLNPEELEQHVDLLANISEKLGAHNG